MLYSNNENVEEVELEPQIQAQIDTIVKDIVMEEYINAYLNLNTEEKPYLLVNFSKNNTIELTENECEEYINQFLLKAYSHEMDDNDEINEEKLKLKHGLFIDLIRQKIKSQKLSRNNTNEKIFFDELLETVKKSSKQQKN